MHLHMDVSSGLMQWGLCDFMQSECSRIGLSHAVDLDSSSAPTFFLNGRWCSPTDRETFGASGAAVITPTGYVARHAYKACKRTHTIIIITTTTTIVIFIIITIIVVVTLCHKITSTRRECNRLQGLRGSRSPAGASLRATWGWGAQAARQQIPTGLVQHSAGSWRHNWWNTRWEMGFN